MKVGGTNFDHEISRFFEDAKRGMEGYAGSRLTKLKQETPRFFEGARQGLQVLRSVVIEFDCHLASRFNFFHSIALFKSIKAEERISYVFAFLLDPDGPHGQQDLFLTAFLDHLRENEKTQSAIKRILPDGSTWAHVKVSWEACTTHIDDSKRIDLVISMRVEGKPEPVGIGIENKATGAPDRDNQLRDYAKELHARYGEDFTLIYLTQKEGIVPSENSIHPEKREKLKAERKLANVPIQDWTSEDGWLKRAEDEVKAERVRWFVSDFRKALIESLPVQEEDPKQKM